MLIQIKDFQGGMVTNADPGDLGADFVIQNENFVTDQPGRLRNRLGRSAVNTIDSLRFDDLRYWSPSNLKINGTSPDSYWIGFDASNGNKLKFLPSNIMGSVTATDLGSAYSSNIPTAFDLQDHGTEFRLAPDNLNHGPQVLQYIARNYFESSSTLDEYVFQSAFPEYPSSTAMKLDNITAYVIGSATSGVSITPESYKYKISPIFDGVQELPLPATYESIIIQNNTSVPQLKITFTESSTGTAPNKTFGLNPRITAIKIYRETANSGSFFNISTIPINTSLSHTNVVSSMAPGTVLPGKDYVFSNTFIDSYTDLISATGIFSQPDITTSSHNNLAYKWIIVMINDAGVQDAINDPDNSPTIFQGGLGNETSDTFSWSGVNGPLDNTTFLSYLIKGFASIAVQPSQTPYYNFNVNGDIKLIRRCLGSNMGNNNIDIVGTDLSLNLSDVVWHNKAVHLYSLSDSERFMANQITGGVFRNYQSNTTSQYLIVNSLGKSIYLDVDTDNISSNAGEVFRDYSVTKNSSSNELCFFDNGLTNGTQQPFPDDFKVRVNYKYSQMMGNRLFVGNVRLDPGGDNEDHPDWVVYSEPGMPDVLPIVNYIQIKDQQGGEIIAMNNILDSLVILMTRGIFRLDVGSSGEPSGFTLMESNKNVGCIAPKGVINIKDNIFFCALDNIYQISPDFTFTPITEPIKDIYQSTSPLSPSRLFYDVKRNNLICKFGNRTTYYIYSLTSNSWSKWTSTVNTPDFFTINDTLNVYTLQAVTASSGGSSGGGSGDTGGQSGGDSGGSGGATP